MSPELPSSSSPNPTRCCHSHLHSHVAGVAPISLHRSTITGFITAAPICPAVLIHGVVRRPVLPPQASPLFVASCLRRGPNPPPRIEKKTENKKKKLEAEETSRPKRKK
ncbi:hypothetical protein M0R45_019696 [Rubus argutus]|uniref:Uncharacterized protein n=1 Tax=Rubus argutus TaxID=59490 RepID=A0AAW1X9B3_RUBAR